jgi:hypothetical protein
MQVFRNISLLALLFLTVSASAESLPPANAIKEIKTAFPNCDISSSSVGSLYGKNSRDVASSLYCKAESYQNEKELSGPYAIAILAEGKNGAYHITYKTTGNLLDFRAEINKGALFLHAAPSGPGGQTDVIYTYQFQYDGKDLMLIGMETESMYKGTDEPTEDQEYEISVNCLTGMVIDSRISRKPKKIADLHKISLEEFDYESGCGS